MKQAVYGPNNAGHFGLGLERYMHFTSPIRRYPDLLVHRAIKSILQAKTNRAGWVPSMEQLVALGEHCSTNERRAESAGWTVEAWLKCDLVKRQEGEELPGTIAGVTEFGLFVDLDGFYVQGLLHISDLGADYFRYDPRRQRLVGDRSGKRFTLGDALSVVVANVEPPQGKIELQLFPMSNRRGGKSSGERKAKAAPESKAALKTKNGAKADGKNKGARKGGAKGKTSGIGAAENSPSKSKKNARKKKQTTPKALKRKRKNNG
jgi:ribonuclease R